MTEFAFRPRFLFLTPLPADEVKLRMQQHLSAPGTNGFRLGGTGHHLILRYRQDLRHAWTPQLDLDLEERPKGTRARVLIGPSPSIWMLFMGGYLLCAVLALLGLSIAVSQQVVGADPWGWLLAAPTPIIAVVLWLVAQAGKLRSREEMHALKRFVDEALGCDCLALAGNP
ncbi:MAG: hypothetical protein H6597_01785 [Flavobacteriales bacterium]|nr:hypothetical protein [Flavobacteriales bacterium]MCB9193238.1 hypothetical protein [Flavobacteriales bacterium]